MKSIGSINPISDLSESLDEIKDTVAIDDPTTDKPAGNPVSANQTVDDKLKTSGSDAA